MRVSYDRETDILTVELRPQAVVDSLEERPGLVLDFDGDGDLVALELFDASVSIFAHSDGLSVRVRGIAVIGEDQERPGE
jgi:uncharacterized protein YuzE